MFYQVLRQEDIEKPKAYERLIGMKIKRGSKILSLSRIFEAIQDPGSPESCFLRADGTLQEETRFEIILLTNHHLPRTPGQSQHSTRGQAPAGFPVLFPFPFSFKTKGGTQGNTD